MAKYECVTIDTFDKFRDEIKFMQPWLREEFMDVGGGTISIEDIDRIKEYPQAEVVTISGLKQDTFEYFIETYGHQFKAIRFWKNKLVSDWSLLGELPDLEFIHWFHNQRISSFWDMSKNIALKAIGIEDFTRLKSLEGIESAPNLEWLSIGDAVWATSVVNSYSPLKFTKIKHLDFYGANIIDKDFAFLKEMKCLREFNFLQNLLTTEQVAWIVANCPDLKGQSLCPAKILNGSPRSFDEQYVYVTGKGKRGFVLEGNQKRLRKIEDDFQMLVEKYRGADYPL